MRTSFLKRSFILIAVSITSAALTLLNGTTLVHAEKVSVVVDGENLRNSPNGKILAKVREGTRLQVLGQRGRWLRVQFNGWVYRPQPKDTDAPPSATAIEATSQQKEANLPAVTLARYQFDWFPQDYNRDRGSKRAHVKLRLWFDNNVDYTLSAVQYTLQLVDATGRLVLKKEVDDDIPIMSGAEEIPAIWHQWEQQGGKGGEVYRKLKNAAELGDLEARVEIKSAFFNETGQTPVENKAAE